MADEAPQLPFRNYFASPACSRVGEPAWKPSVFKLSNPKGWLMTSSGIILPNILIIYIYTCIYIYLYSNIPRRESLLTNQYNYWGLSQYSIHPIGDDHNAAWKFDEPLVSAGTTGGVGLRCFPLRVWGRGVSWS